MGSIARMDKICIFRGLGQFIVPVKIWFCCNVKPKLTKNHGSLRFHWILTRAQMNFRGNDLKSKSEKYEKCCCCDGNCCQGHFEEKLRTGHWCIPWFSEAPPGDSNVLRTLWQLKITMENPPLIYLLNMLLSIAILNRQRLNPYHAISHYSSLSVAMTQHFRKLSLSILSIVS